MQKRYWSALALTLVALPAMAQQSGSISGKLTGKQGQALAGVRIDVTGNVLPQPRRVTTNEVGDYRLPFLPPGEYVLTYTQTDKLAQKRAVSVVLGQNTTMNVSLADSTVASAQVEVVADKASLADATSAELKTTIDAEVLSAMPVGLSYRDLIKLVPGVAYSQQGTRDPSAGGSGQDNVHMMDGVNVNLPMYGTLSTAPASHDIDQVAFSKGGATATDFNRSAGFTMNSITKSGTNTYTGELSYQTTPGNLVARRPVNSTTQFEDSTTYRIANIGGPIIKERLFFFGSFFGPSSNRKNSSNAYGPVPELETKRNEAFGKLTYSPTSEILLHASYRKSNETDTNTGLGATAAPSVADGSKKQVAIATLEASWAVNAHNFLNLKFSSYGNYNSGYPNYRSAVKPVLDYAAASVINPSQLATQGTFSVPTYTNAIGNQTFLDLITQYGYPGTGAQAYNGIVGGGVVGGAALIETDNFFRKNYQLAWDGTFGSSVTHELHAGYQWLKESEDLYRISNGWGSISANTSNAKIPAGSLVGSGLGYVYSASVYQQGLGRAPQIHSEFRSQNLEFNDKIRWQKFTFNVGLLVSNDKMYGEGLRTDPSTTSGYALAPGQQYLETEIKWKDTLQPRLGITYNYAKEDSVYGNYARYTPAASSLPRAASWARSLNGTINVYFDKDGRLIGQGVDAVSAGKFFTPGMKPRHTDEFMLGTTKDFGSGFTSRFYGRYRKSVNFWEDTPNNARVVLNPPAGVPRDLYIPNYATLLSNLGRGGAALDGNTTAVIAQLDGAFTKFYEVSAETEWRGTNAYLSFSYTWSHYYGNFDQDNSGAGGVAGNDFNAFIGSSNLADSAGTQVWENHYGNLTGDQRHKVKVYGSYSFPWQGKAGIFAVYQSGQHWQKASFQPYLAESVAAGAGYGTISSDTARYAEPAGSREMPAHYQVDLNYTQTFWKSKNMVLSGMVDVYNVFNRQTPVSYVQAWGTASATVPSATYGTVNAYISPRRTQLGVKFLF